MFNQRRQSTQKGHTRTFNTFEANEQMQANYDRAHDASSHRRERLTARRESSVVRGRGRVVGRGRTMSSQSPANKLEQGLNESLFGSPHVPYRNEAQGIFTRQQQCTPKPAFTDTQKDLSHSFNKQPFSMSQSTAFDFTLTPQKPEFGGAQQQPVFGRPSFGGKAPYLPPVQPLFGDKTSTLLGAAQHQPLFGGNARAVQQPEYASKRSFNETDAESIALTDSRKKQNTVNQQQPKEAVFGKRNLNPQAVSFKPANTSGKQALNPQAVPFQPADAIGRQALNPQATPFKPVNKFPFDDAMKQNRVVERRKVIFDPDAPTRLEEVVGFKGACENMCPEPEMPIGSTPQNNQQGNNKSRPETPKALEAAADPIIEQQRMEALMKRTAEQKECARQRVLQAKEEQKRRQRALQEQLRLEEEQTMMDRKEKVEQDRARQLEAEVLEKTLRSSVTLHNSNLYKKYTLRTPEIMEDRATISLQSDQIAKIYNVYKNEDEEMENVWKKERFNGLAYLEVVEKIYQPQVEGKHTWTHLISCDPTATNSIQWFAHKFDLDSEFKRKTSRYEEVDITTKLVDSTEQLSPKLNNEVEAITFVLPEKRLENERHDNAFWQSQRKRLAELIQALSKDRPDFQCPLLIPYYSEDISDVHDTLYNIPELLGFKDDKTIMDYHFLLMRKESITTRICDEMYWLFGASVNY